MVDDGDDGSGGVYSWRYRSQVGRGYEETKEQGAKGRSKKRVDEERTSEKKGVKQVGEARCSRLRNVQERFKVTYEENLRK